MDCDERSLTSQRYIDNNISEIMANEKIHHSSSLNRHDPLRGSKNNIDEESCDFEQEESMALHPCEPLLGSNYVTGTQGVRRFK